MFRQQSFFGTKTEKFPFSEENQGDTVFLRRRRVLPEIGDRHTLVFPDTSPLADIMLDINGPIMPGSTYLGVRVKSFTQSGFLRQYLPQASVHKEMFTGRDYPLCTYDFEKFGPKMALQYMEEIFAGVSAIDEATALYFTPERKAPFFAALNKFYHQLRSGVKYDDMWESREEPIQQINIENVNKALEMAIDNYEVDTVEKLLTEGADPNSFTSNGYTMLRFVIEKCPLLACQESKVEETEKLAKILELLMLRNANPLLISRDNTLPEIEILYRIDMFGSQSVIRSIFLKMLELLKARATPSEFKVPEEAKNIKGVDMILQGNAAIKKRLTPKAVYKKITPPMKTSETGGFTYKFETYNEDILEVIVERVIELTSEAVDFFWKLFRKFELDKNKSEEEFVNYFWNELSEHGRPRYICILCVTKKDKTSYVGGFLTFEGYPTTLNGKEAFIVYIPLSQAHPQVSADFERSMTFISKVIGQALAKSFDGKVEVKTMFEAASKYPLLQIGLEDLEMSLNNSKQLALVPQACAAVYGEKESLNLIRCRDQYFKKDPLKVSVAAARDEKPGCRTFAHIVGAYYESLEQASNLLDPTKKALVTLVADNLKTKGALARRLDPLTIAPDSEEVISFSELVSRSASFFRKLFEPESKVPYALKDKEEEYPQAKL